MDVDSELVKLTLEQKIEYHNTLVESLYDRSWCSINNINYINPDMSKVKEVLYNEMFSKNYKD